MSLIPTRWRRAKAPEGAEQPVSEQPGRLVGPGGSVAWICATPAGRKDCAHDTEAQAEAHGAREGRVWWPVVVDERETA